MKKLFLGLFLIFGLTIGFLNFDIKAGEPTGTTTVTYTYVVNLNGTQQTPVNLTANYGTSISFDAGTQSGYEYVGHLDQGKLISTLNQAVSIRVTENTYVQYYFKTAGEVAIIFMDTNLNFVTTRYTDNDGETPTNKMIINEANPLPLYSNFSKPGLSSSGWTSDGVTAIDFVNATFTSDTVVYPLYSTSVNNLTLSITNGTALVEGPYDFNEVVTVTANTAPENYTFSHWTKDGVIVSYDSQYTFTIASDHTLEAVNVLTSSYVAHTDNFVSISQPYSLKDGYQTLVGQFDLAEGETLVEYGFVHSNIESTPTLATTSTQVEYSNKYSSATKEFVMSFSIANYELSKYYRAFITTINGTSVSTSYSEVLTKSINEVQIWFYNSNNWANVKAHIWDSGTVGTVNWPGLQTTQELDGETPTGWWYVSVPVADRDSVVAELQYSFKIVFNNGLTFDDERKTEDIYIDNETGLYVVISGDVYQSKPEISRVHFQLPVWDPALSIPDIYFWGGTDFDYAWRGVSMTSEGDGWYYYDITTTTTNYNIIISAVQSGVRKQSVTIVVNQGQDIYVTMGSTWNGNEFSVNITDSKP
jgi:hypothetical protein